MTIRPQRLGWFAPLLGLMLLTGPDVFAQDGEPELVQEVKSLNTRDGWSIPITYFGNYSKNTPVIIMLAGEGSSRLAWDRPLVKLAGSSERLSLPRIFQEQGYAVITVDLRKMGKSSYGGVSRPMKPTSRDYKPMALGDLVAVKSFIYAEHQAGHLNMRKTGIIASDYTAMIAATFALSDWLLKPHSDAPTLATRTPRGQDIRAIAMLSPEDNLPFLNTGIYRDLASPAFDVGFFFGIGSQDNAARTRLAKIQKVVDAAAGRNAERIWVKEYRGKASGVDLVTPTNTELVKNLYAFFEKYLKERPEPWRNRQSALESP